MFYSSLLANSKRQGSGILRVDDSNFFKHSRRPKEHSKELNSFSVRFASKMDKL